MFRVGDDWVTSTTMVMAPGVSVLNARTYSQQNPQVMLVADVVLPLGYVYTEFVAKTSRPDGKTSFYVDVLLPYNLGAHANGPVDATVWFRTAPTQPA